MIKTAELAAERMLGIGVGFIIITPVLYNPKYIYSIQTDTNLISIYSIDCYGSKLQEPQLLPSTIINSLMLLELFSSVLKMANTTCRHSPLHR